MAEAWMVGSWESDNELSRVLYQPGFEAKHKVRKHKDVS